MKDSSTFGDRVWAGDNTTVAEALERFVHAQDERKEILPCASVLYSFRQKPNAAIGLLALRRLLLEYQDFLVSQDSDSYLGSSYLDRADMLSTYFTWMGARKELTWSQQKRILHHALVISDTARVEAQSLIGTEKAHTYYLLMLTCASLQINRGSATELLRIIDLHVSNEPRLDPRQRVRIYAKLGLLMREDAVPTNVGYWLRGARWGIRAVFVPNVPANVRMKALAALVGIQK